MIRRTLASTPAVTEQPPRLTMVPAGGGDRGALDGAWWPHGRDLAAELPALISGLNGWLDTPIPGHGAHVSRISINLTSWDAVPAHVDHTGRRVRLSWFGTVDAHTLAVTCTDGSHLELLTIPPQADPRQALAVTATAIDPANTLRGAAILARVMPELLRGPGPDRRWAARAAAPAPAWSPTPDGRVHLLDDGDPDETGSSAPAWQWPAR
jgi:hypothetical protein